MLISFNPGKNDLLTMEFETKNEYDRYIESCNEPGQLMPYNNKPDRFPCLMVYDNNILPIIGEKNFYYNFFIYHYANA